MLLEIQTAAAGALSPRSIESVRVREAVGEHASFRAQLHLGEERETVLSSVGREISWREGQELLFKGIVSRVSHRQGETVIEALGESCRLDFVKRTRSFLPPKDGSGLPGASPSPVGQLEGFRSAFQRSFTGFASLDAQVVALHQFEETDWAFMNRVAALSGCFLVARDEGTWVTAGPVDEATLSPNDVLDRETEATARLVVPESESLTWHLDSGRQPGSPSAGESQATGFDAERLALAEAARLAGGKARHREFRPALPGLPSDATVARELARRRQSDCFRVRVETLAADVRLGAKLSLPGASDLAADLVVLERTLRFDPHAESYQLVSSLDCGPAGLGLAPHQPPPRPAVTVLGQVRSVEDPLKLGRVLVGLPWHPGGVWCTVPQAFGGKDGGALQLPLPADWVQVLLEPFEQSPPTLLGSLYRGDAPAPPVKGPFAESRVLAATPAGHQVLLADADGATTTLAVLNGTEAVCSIELKKGSKKVLVSAKDGEVSVSGKTVRLAGEVEIEGNVTVKGKLSVE